MNHRSIVVISLFVLLCTARATRAQSTDKDGFGDWQFLIKYRILASNEEHGNYILTAFFFR